MGKMLLYKYVNINKSKRVTRKLTYNTTVITYGYNLYLRNRIGID